MIIAIAIDSYRKKDCVALQFNNCYYRSFTYVYTDYETIMIMRYIKHDKNISILKHLNIYKI